MRDFDAELPLIGAAHRHGVLRRRHAEPVRAGGFRRLLGRCGCASRSPTTPRSPWRRIPAPSSAAASPAIATPASIESRWARRPSRRARSAPGPHPLGRGHLPRRRGAARRGLDNFNLDLMYALPSRHSRKRCSTSQRLRARTHAYFLLPAHAGAGHGVSFAAAASAGRGCGVAMQSEGQALLAAAGYAQYEVSAYARPGARCRHNLNYWLFGDYVGIGAGAHGKLTEGMPTGYCAPPSRNSRAISRNGCVVGGSHRRAHHVVRVRDLPFEFMLNALRLNEGFSTAVLRSPHGACGRWPTRRQCEIPRPRGWSMLRTRDGSRRNWADDS
jgi:hypothetical protein